MESHTVGEVQASRDSAPLLMIATITSIQEHSDESGLWDTVRIICSSMLYSWRTPAGQYHVGQKVRVLVDPDPLLAILNSPVPYYRHSRPTPPA